MVHSEIEKSNTVERYIRNQLNPSQRQEFEEHFFTCDECFAKLQTSERFAAGVRDAAERGLLDAPSQPQLTNPGRFAWVLATMACIGLVFAGGAGWIYFRQVSHLRSELRQTTAQLQSSQQFRVGTEPISPSEQAEANLPLVMLQASRAAEEPESVILKPDDRRLVLWIELGPSPYRDFRLDVFSSDNHLITSVDHLRLTRYGALAAGLPTKRLPVGDFRITLTGQDPPPAALAGEYRLKIRRP